MWTTTTFNWRIQNFSEVCGLQSGVNDDDNDNIMEGTKEYESLLDIDFLQSPMITVESGSQQTRWFISLVKSPQVNNDVDVYIYCDEITQINETAPEGKCFFKYRLQIQGSATTESILTKGSSKIISMKEGMSWREPGFLKINLLKNGMADVLEDDTLTLKIELSLLNDVHHSNNDYHRYEYSSFPVTSRKAGDINSSERKWAENVASYGGDLAKCMLSSLWSNRSCTGDITIECAGSRFPAHKTILSGASPVFLAAFSLDMTERASGKLKIDDMSPEVLETLLKFIYNDFYLALEEHKWKNVDYLAELLNAAEKYQIVQLKMLCFSKICEELSLNNAGKIVVIAHLFNPEENVKTFIHQFVINNIGVLQGMKSFKEKMNEVPAAFTPLLLIAKN